MKSENGKDIIVYGGSSFVTALAKEKLIDEFHLFIHPIALGKGASIFQDLDHWQKLQLRNSVACDCGIVIQRYELIG